MEDFSLSYTDFPPVLGTQEMRALDNAAKDFPFKNRTESERIHAGFLLMQEAGAALFRFVRSFELEPIAVFIGGGNNGGDGLVLVKLLHEAHIPYTLFSLAPQEKFRNEAALALKEFLEAGGAWNEFSEDASNSKFKLVVDCMLGNGASGELRPAFAAAVKRINSWNTTIIAADAPTGYDSANRRSTEHCINAHHTMMFGYPRLDAFVKNGAENFGDSVTAALSYPKELVEKFDSHIYLANDSLIPKLLPHKSDWEDKRKQGCLLTVAGSRDMTGAAILCTAAALRSGTGLVTLASPECIIPVLQSRLTESVFCSLPDTSGNRGFLSPSHIETLLQRARHSQAAAIGPGISMNKETVEAVLELLPQLKIPTVIDADALNAIATLNAKTDASLDAVVNAETSAASSSVPRQAPSENSSRVSGAVKLLNKLGSDCILTPHKREYARLFGDLPQDIFDVPEHLRNAARISNKVIILKTTPLFIANPAGNVYVVPAANAGMAKGGCGDVLTGIVAALLAQGMSTTNAAILGALLHQKAGRIVRNELGVFSMLPSDLIEHLHQAFSEKDVSRAASKSC